MSDISRNEENAAFDKLRTKLDRLTSASDRSLVLPRLTVRDLKALLQFYRRNS